MVERNIVIILIAALFGGCSSNPQLLEVQIGEQIWAARNLDIPLNGSWYYDQDSIKNRDGGRLYLWETAKNACPEGWRLPTDEDWKVLESFVGIPQDQLEQKNWRGTDQALRLRKGGDTGFNEQYAGYREWFNDQYKFVYKGVSADYWTATEVGKDSVWVRGFSPDNNGFCRYVNYKKEAFSIRCIKRK